MREPDSTWQKLIQLSKIRSNSSSGSRVEFIAMETSDIDKKGFATVDMLNHIAKCFTCSQGLFRARDEFLL